MKTIIQSVLIIGILFIFSTGPAISAKVILLKDNYPSSSAELLRKLRGGIISAGCSVNEVDAACIHTALGEEMGPGTILILPNAACFPANAKSSLVSFLKRGNHLLAISGPAFKELVVEYNGHWLNQDQAKEELIPTEGSCIVDFTNEDISTWKRYAGTLSNETTHSLENINDSRIRGKALHISISKLDDWETFVSAPIPHPFPTRHTATVFWAKGGPDTPELVVEWREQDSSRWMAVVTLSQEWKRYVLTPEDYRFWGDGSPTGRGKPGDQFYPANAEAISFGIANGISRQEMNTAHEYWVADIQAAVNPTQDTDFTPPLLESLSPSYKTHNTAADALRLIPWDEAIPTKTRIVASIPRSPGYGSDSLRKWRFIPVIEAYDSDGELRGYAAHMFLNTTGDYSGSIWGYIGLDQQFLTQSPDKTIQVVTHILDRMNRGIFLSNAGTEYAAYVEGEEVKCGAYLVNWGSEKADYVDTMFQLFKDGKILASDYVRTELAPRSKPVFVDGSAAIRGIISDGPGVYRMVVWTAVRGKIVDEIAHEFNVIDYKPLEDRDIVKTRGNDFFLNNSKWYPLGINYWPRYAAALEPEEFKQHWLSPEQYNPDIVEQDLSLAEKLGMNMVSIQYNEPNQARSLMDFMARAQKHGIKVHMYIPGLHPLHQNFKLANELITRAHLSETPALFAYDAGWEVHVGKYDRRKTYDRQWQDWVIERYGSVENAENDWGYKPDQVEGIITGPSDEQLLNDGIWRVYVAAYRRFWDDEISRRYMAVRNNIKSVDPHHLIGARSGYGGTGSLWAVPNFPFDLRSGAKHLDFTSPEAYGLGGDKSGFLKGGFNTLYGRFVSNGKPVFWAEYGASIWPQCDAKVLEETRSYYENILDMTYASGANGSAGWWWPGGFRLVENSDFGIVNPDGTPRPAALEIQKFSPKFTTSREASTPNYFINIDRDKYVSGYAGIFSSKSLDYVDALLSGKMPGMKTEGFDTSSADTPLVAVGNVPCNGHNPPKYLNAEFNYVKINGILIRDGETITVDRGKPVVAEVSVGNTADATWIPPHTVNEGAVALILGTEGGTSEHTSTNWSKTSSKSERINFVHKIVPYLSDIVFQEIEIPDGANYVSMRMTAVDRVEFGEVFEVNIRYK